VYFEPSREEHSEGSKAPAAAHRALARMVAKGKIRVILTTNFDHLIETALRDEGLAPAVVSAADALQGMLPLHLAPVTVIKLHGDYLDTRVKNIPEELAHYDPAFDLLLDRALDEYGLVVCGWSATWDDALRTAIMRCPSRRFTAYWATRGDGVGGRAHSARTSAKPCSLTEPSGRAIRGWRSGSREPRCTGDCAIRLLLNVSDYPPLFVAFEDNHRGRLLWAERIHRHWK
jgi:hypothetical protein